MYFEGDDYQHLIDDSLPPVPRGGSVTYCCYCFRDIKTQADVDAAVFVQQTRYETRYACKDCAPMASVVILDTDLPEEL